MTVTRCLLSPQGLVTLLKLWLRTLPCHTLSSRHGLSSTCSHPSLLSFRGLAARILGTQVRDIFTLLEQHAPLAFWWLYPGLSVEGVIVAVLPSVVIRCSHSLGAKVLLLAPRWAFEHLCFIGAAGCSGVLSSHWPTVWICVVVFFMCYIAVNNYMDLINQGM